MKTEAEKLLKRGEYAQAEKLFKAEISKAQETSSSNLKASLLGRMVCLEQLGREQEVHSMMQDAHQTYNDVLRALSDDAVTLKRTYSSRYARPHEAKAEALNTFRTILGNVEELRKGSPHAHSHKKRRLHHMTHVAYIQALHCNPLTLFPPNVVKKILAELGTVDLVRACQVSRLWHAIIVSSSELYTKPKFHRDAGVADMTAFVKTCRKNHIRKISSMQIANLKCGQEGPLMRTLFLSKLEVHSLVVAGCGFDFSMMDKCHESYNAFRHLSSIKVLIKLADNINLNSLFGCIFHLKDISISIGGDLRKLDHMKQIWFGPTLKRFLLMLNDDSDAHVNADVFLRHCTFEHVRHLTLDTVIKASDTMVRVLKEMSPEKVTYQGPKPCGFLMLEALSRADVQLRVLELEGLGRIPYDDEYTCLSTVSELHLFGNVPWLTICLLLEETQRHLTVLKLEASDEAFDILVGNDPLAPMSRFSFAEVFQMCPKLQDFAILGSPCFTEKRCAELFHALKHSRVNLKSLTLSCQRLTNTGILSLFHRDFSFPSTDLHLLGDRFSKSTIRTLKKHCNRVYYGSLVRSMFASPQFTVGRFVEG